MAVKQNVGTGGDPSDSPSSPTHHITSHLGWGSSLIKEGLGDHIFLRGKGTRFLLLLFYPYMYDFALVMRCKDLNIRYGGRNMDIGVGVSVDGVEWDVVKRHSPPSTLVSLADAGN